MRNVIKRMRELYPVSDSAVSAITALFKEHMFPARTTIIEAGKFDGQVYFIEQGITRSYILHNGKETTTWFSKEGDAACGSWDLFRNKAGFEYVQTLEKTKAYSISVYRLNALYREDIDIANWMRVLQQENFLWLQEMHIDRLNLSVRQRYLKLLRDCPDIYNRVNLGYIASFLGTTLPTLSKIRSEL